MLFVCTSILKGNVDLSAGTAMAWRAELKPHEEAFCIFVESSVFHKHHDVAIRTCLKLGKDFQIGAGGVKAGPNSSESGCKFQIDHYGMISNSAQAE